ncbi:MAG: type II secretion system protein [Planctomycetes bacterium]|nr:type II secretion system protein [Planctomycetota bacterium]
MNLGQEKRAGFTLIELLVVIAIIVILASLTAAVLPNLRNRQRASQGAAQVQGWLLEAKEWALRDQAPRGLRLIDPGPPNHLVTTLQYIEQPADLIGGQITFNNTTATDAKTDFSGGFASANDPTLWPVQKGDYLEVDGQNQLFGIAAVPNTTTLTLTNAPVPPAATFSGYRIIRGARVRVGETPLQMSSDVAIDLNTNGWYGNPLPYNPNIPNYVDIMFAPSGTVLVPGAGNDKIQLWVRDTSQDQPGTQTFSGDQTLITVYIRTGRVAPNPVDVTLNPNNNNQYFHPYAFTWDGLTSSP